MLGWGMYMPRHHFMGALLEGKRSGCFKNQKVDVKRTSHGAANNCVSVSRYVYLVSFTMESSVVHLHVRAALVVSGTRSCNWIFWILARVLGSDRIVIK